MTLQIADPPVTPEELADVRALLTSGVAEPVRGACRCSCGCQGAVGGTDTLCRCCGTGEDHLWREAVR